MITLEHDTEVEPSPDLEPPQPELVRTRRPSGGLVLFLACAALYTAVGAILVFRYGSIAGDAYSRVSNARYVLDSRDPKLAAIGFVWMPLPTLLLVPLVPLQGLWPDLVGKGFIGNIESALFMAGAVVLLRRTLIDLGVQAVPRAVLVLLFAVNPIIIDYGANGMSEAMFMCFLLAAVCPLARWLRTPSTRSLVLSGIALGLAYATRYEALVAVAAVAGLVVVVTLARERADLRDGWRIALSDGLLVCLPATAVVVVWTATSWLIVGQPFDTFTSRYGNAAQVGAAQGSIRNATGGTKLDALSFVGRQTFLLAPALLLVAVVALALAWRRRDLWIAAPISVLASVMAFQAATLLAGQSFGWLRYQISAVPLTALLVGYLVAPARAPATAIDLRSADPSTDVATDGASDDLRPGASGRRRVPALAGAVAAIVLTGGAIATTLVAVADPVLAGDEYGRIMPVAHRMTGSTDPDPGALDQYAGEWQIADSIDRMELPDGSVLVDVALGFPIVTDSRRPKAFVITTDRDFDDAVSDPVAAGVTYVLISKDTGTMDAIAARYPNAFQDGAGFGHLVREFHSPLGNGRTWRLYRIGSTP